MHRASFFAHENALNLRLTVIVRVAIAASVMRLDDSGDQ